MSSANNIAYTALINPNGSTPLSHDQIWAGLLLKIRSAETFVPAAISHTKVLSESIDPTGNPVTVREVFFLESGKTVRETVVAYEPTRVDFQQDGGNISNVISEGANGELYMTYIFQWKHDGASKEELEAFLVKEKSMARVAVEGTIQALHHLALEKKL
ncbi:uncharacterized protein N7483_005600 [Penicillium malachiteum]|uniref:uncharacterized protein n=1 Tax=Penicillium malachiteum TaxID=1324776 RepID=UPI002548CE90|nr:uncharacterized protein N7483_005600 [Penicillium malachiteum]KAJ5731092.1 hypothetical protein N7483_005600 [Penicillium malachiteum]